MKFLHEYMLMIILIMSKKVVIMLVSTLGPNSICHSSYAFIW